MIPLRDLVIFPFTEATFKVDRRNSVLALEKAMSADRKVFLITRRGASVEEPTLMQVYGVGTIARVVAAQKEEEGNYKIFVEGRERAKIVNIEKDEGALVARVQPIKDAAEKGKPNSWLMRRIGKLAADEYFPVVREGLDEYLKEALHNTSPSQMADKVAAYLPLISFEDKQKLLETFSVHRRLQRLLALLEAEEGRGQHPSTRQTGRGYGKESKTKPSCVFIGHGRSPLWARLKIFLEEFGLITVNFESESHAGESIITVLKKMLDDAGFAVLILTAEDETISGGRRARQNVVHEAGLFQGRLGFNKAILLVQEGLEEFSNVAGLQYIRFSGDRIDQTFHELQRVLEREGLIKLARK